MKTSNRGIELIKVHEGFRSHAYLCPAGKWTIGYGHTGGVKSGDVITETQGESLLRSDIVAAERVVDKTGLKLKQNQFDALVSFVFNVGGGNFRGSTLLRIARQDVCDPRIGKEFSRWVYAKGKVLPGLMARRKDETALYFNRL